MWLIVGLGNPGAKYLLSRHNLGWMALDYLARGAGVKPDLAKSEHRAETLAFTWDSEQVKLVKPQTYMNESGLSVGPLARFYKVELDHVLVIYDEMDLPFSQIRIRQNGSAGGHNGMKSLIEHLGSDAFPRIRVGVGRPATPMDPSAYILQNFSKTEQGVLPDLLNKVTDAIESVVFDGVLKAMNNFNTTKKEDTNGI